MLIWANFVEKHVLFYLVPYTPSNNNNQDRKKSKKTSKKQNPSKNGICIENAPLNGISFENSSARGGPTLQYDQQLQPLVERTRK